MEILSKTVKPVWNNVKITSEEAGNIYQGDDNLAYAVKMVSRELLENAIKYGLAELINEPVSFQITEENNEITIQVTNRVILNDDLMRVIHHLKEVKACDDYKQLYIDKLKNINKNRKAGVSRLGFYRIVYEAKFDLDYQYKNNFLTICAIRKK